MAEINDVFSEVSKFIESPDSKDKNIVRFGLTSDGKVVSYGKNDEIENDTVKIPRKLLKKYADTLDASEVKNILKNVYKKSNKNILKSISHFFQRTSKLKKKFSKDIQSINLKKSSSHIPEHTGLEESKKNAPGDENIIENSTFESTRDTIESKRDSTIESISNSQEEIPFADQIFNAYVESRLVYNDPNTAPAIKASLGKDFMYETPNYDSQIESKWKAHISVDANKLEEACQLIVSKSLEHGVEFKAKIGRQTKEAEILDNESFQPGKQITIMIPDTYVGDKAEEFYEFLKDIDNSLSELNIDPDSRGFNSNLDQAKQKYDKVIFDHVGYRSDSGTIIDTVPEDTRGNLMKESDYAKLKESYNPFDFEDPFIDFINTNTDSIAIDKFGVNYDLESDPLVDIQNFFKSIQWKLNDQIMDLYNEELTVLQRLGGSAENVDITKYQFRNGYCKECCSRLIQILDKTNAIVKLEEDINKYFLSINGAIYQINYCEDPKEMHGWIELIPENENNDPIIIEPSYKQFIGVLNDENLRDQQYYNDCHTNDDILYYLDPVFVGNQNDFYKILNEYVPQTNREKEDQEEILGLWENSTVNLKKLDEFFNY